MMSSSGQNSSFRGSQLSQEGVLCPHVEVCVRTPPEGLEIKNKKGCLCLGCYCEFPSEDEMRVHAIECALQHQQKLTEEGEEEEEEEEDDEEAEGAEGADVSETKTFRHHLCLNMKVGNFFCFKCRDYVSFTVNRKLRMIYAFATVPDNRNRENIRLAIRDMKATQQDWVSFQDVPKPLRNIFGNSSQNVNLIQLTRRWRAGNFGKKVVIMAGAGISVSAGIPDFRSPGSGLYHNLQKYSLGKPEDMFSIDFFRKNCFPFYHLARSLWPMQQHVPTPTHFFMRLLQDKGVLQAVYTQNIDGLEAEAGVDTEKVGEMEGVEVRKGLSQIVEAHGSFSTGSCIDCRTPFPILELRNRVMAKDVPVLCRVCCPAELDKKLRKNVKWILKNGGDLLEVSKQLKGETFPGLVKPDIVFFGEKTHTEIHSRPQRLDADLLLIMGTSLKVSPFNTLHCAVKRKVPRVLINKEKVIGKGIAPLNFDSAANYRDIYLGEASDAGVEQIVRLLGWEDEWKVLMAERETIREKILEAKKHCPISEFPSTLWGSPLLSPFSKIVVSPLEVIIRVFFTSKYLVFLKAIPVGDAESLFECYMSDKERIGYYIDVGFGTPSQASAAVARWREKMEAGEGLFFGIYKARQHEEGEFTSELCGHVRAEVLNGALFSISLEYWIHKEHAGGGIVTRSAVATIQYAFDVFFPKVHKRNVTACEIVCHPENYASQAVAIRLGFTEKFEEGEVTKGGKRGEESGNLIRRRFRLVRDAEYLWNYRLEQSPLISAAKKSKKSFTAEFYPCLKGVISDFISHLVVSFCAALDVSCITEESEISLKFQGKTLLAHAWKISTVVSVALEKHIMKNVKGPDISCSFVFEDVLPSKLKKAGESKWRLAAAEGVLVIPPILMIVATGLGMTHQKVSFHCESDNVTTVFMNSLDSTLAPAAFLQRAIRALRTSRPAGPAFPSEVSEGSSRCLSAMQSLGNQRLMKAGEEACGDENEALTTGYSFLVNLPIDAEVTLRLLYGFKGASMLWNLVQEGMLQEKTLPPFLKTAVNLMACNDLLESWAEDAGEEKRLILGIFEDQGRKLVGVVGGEIKTHQSGISRYVVLEYWICAGTAEDAKKAETFLRVRELSILSRSIIAAIKLISHLFWAGGPLGEAWIFCPREERAASRGGVDSSELPRVLSFDYIKNAVGVFGASVIERGRHDRRLRKNAKSNIKNFRAFRLKLETFWWSLSESSRRTNFVRAMLAGKSVAANDKGDAGSAEYDFVRYMGQAEAGTPHGRFSQVGSPADESRFASNVTSIIVAPPRIEGNRVRRGEGGERERATLDEHDPPPETPFLSVTASEKIHKFISHVPPRDGEDPMQSLYSELRSDTLLAIKKSVAQKKQLIRKVAGRNIAELRVRMLHSLCVLNSLRRHLSFLEELAKDLQVYLPSKIPTVEAITLEVEENLKKEEAQLASFRERVGVASNMEGFAEEDLTKDELDTFTRIQECDRQIVNMEEKLSSLQKALRFLHFCEGEGEDGKSASCVDLEGKFLQGTLPNLPPETYTCSWREFEDESEDEFGSDLFNTILHSTLPMEKRPLENDDQARMEEVAEAPLLLLAGFCSKDRRKLASSLALFPPTSVCLKELVDSGKSEELDLLVSSSRFMKPVSARYLRGRQYIQYMRRVYSRKRKEKEGFGENQGPRLQDLDGSHPLGSSSEKVEGSSEETCLALGLLALSPWLSPHSSAENLRITSGEKSRTGSLSPRRFLPGNGCDPSGKPKFRRRRSFDCASKAVNCSMWWRIPRAKPEREAGMGEPWIRRGFIPPWGRRRGEVGSGGI